MLGTGILVERLNGSMGSSGFGLVVFVGIGFIISCSGSWSSTYFLLGFGILGERQKKLRGESERRIFFHMKVGRIFEILIKPKFWRFSFLRRSFEILNFITFWRLIFML